MCEDINEEMDVGRPDPVSVHLYSYRRSCTEYAGWLWFGDALTDDEARSHLKKRIEARNPLYGGTDYGIFGSPLEEGLLDLDPDFYSTETLTKLARYLDEQEEPPPH